MHNRYLRKHVATAEIYHLFGTVSLFNLFLVISRNEDLQLRQLLSLFIILRTNSYTVKTIGLDKV